MAARRISYVHDEVIVVPKRISQIMKMIEKKIPLPLITPT